MIRSPHKVSKWWTRVYSVDLPGPRGIEKKVWAVDFFVRSIPKTIYFEYEWQVQAFLEGRESLRRAEKKSGRKGKRRTLKRNPISVIGNPRRKKSLDTSRIAGVVYGRVIELRAQKIYDGRYKGQFFKHPFAAASKVEALALTDGSILLRSKKGVRLWRES